MLEDRPMPNDYRLIEVITGDARCRRWTIEQQLQIIEQSFEPARCHSSGRAPVAGLPRHQYCFQYNLWAALRSFSR